MKLLLVRRAELWERGAREVCCERNTEVKLSRPKHNFFGLNFLDSRGGLCRKGWTARNPFLSWLFISFSYRHLIWEDQVFVPVVSQMMNANWYSGLIRLKLMLRTQEGLRVMKILSVFLLLSLLKRKFYKINKNHGKSVRFLDNFFVFGKGPAYLSGSWTVEK